MQQSNAQATRGADQTLQAAGREGVGNRYITISDGVVDIVQAGAAMIAFIVVGGPLARSCARRIDKRTVATSAAVPSEVVQRLAAIEQAVDSVAVEVERISEGQRFTTKLLSDRTKSEMERAV